jgi:hypothetical protein
MVPSRASFVLARSATALRHDDTGERVFHRLVRVEAEASAFMEKYTTGSGTQISRAATAIFV